MTAERERYEVVELVVERLGRLETCSREHSLFEALREAVDGRTVAVQPETQIVVLMFAWATSSESTPGGSTNGNRLIGRGAESSAGEGAVVGTVAHAASSTTTNSSQAGAHALRWCRCFVARIFVIVPVALRKAVEISGAAG